MAAKVGLISVDGRTMERVKRGYAQSLCKRLEAKPIGDYLYKRLSIRQPDEIPPQSYIPDYLPSAELPGISVSGLDPATLRDERVLSHMARQFCENCI